LVAGAAIAFWPSSSKPSATPSPSTSPAASSSPSPAPVPVPKGFYQVAPDLCAALDFTALNAGGTPTADHSEKSNYLVYTCDRGNLSVTALIFTAAGPAHDHFADVRQNVTGTTPVADAGAEAFAAGTSLWVYDKNLVLMVRFKTSGGSSTSDLMNAAAGLVRQSLPRLRS
jgi:hypothetical protein